MDQREKIGRGFFITGTDTGVGKTVVTAVLGRLLQKKGFDVGIMKPVQCGGNDAAFLKKFLALKDPLDLINPFFAKEPLSPHTAFPRQKIKIDLSEILQSFQKLRKLHDIMLVEGAGGLLVPLFENYFVTDLIRDLDLEIIVVSRLGLGTINHTLLTTEQAKSCGLKVKGIVFNTLTKKKSGIPEHTNPAAISRLGKIPILGILPYLPRINDKEILSKCTRSINWPAFSKKNASRRNLEQLDKKYVWHPFTQMKDWMDEEPLVIDEGLGNYLIDSKGRKYLDGVSSLWVNVHGHRKKEIDQAVKEQLNKIAHSTFLGLTNTPAVLLAEKLIAIAPKRLKKVFYSDNGSTAVEVAIKMAYQYWQNQGRPHKTAIAHLENSYHGDTLGSVSVGGIALFHQVYQKLIFKTIKVDFPDFYRAPAGKSYPAFMEESLLNMERLFRKQHKTIAALIVEPLVQGAAGMIVWPSGILKRIAGLCRKFNILLIADEVATGFGRTGKMFACEHEGIAPDFLCLAKGLSGGYLPIAATLTTQKIFDGFVFNYKEQKTFFHGHTYTGNPLAAAAALASLDLFLKERILEKLTPKIKYLAEGLQKFYNLASVGDVRQKGLMAGIELVKDRSTKKPFPWEDRIGVKVCRKIRDFGVILRPLGNVIVLMPPLSISPSEIDVLLEATYRAIKEET